MCFGSSPDHRFFQFLTIFFELNRSMLSQAYYQTFVVVELKKINPFVLLLQAALQGRASKRQSVCVCFAAFHFAMVLVVVD